MQSKAEKTTQLAISPERQAEEMLRTIKLYERVIKTMLEKAKNFFKTLWGNKQSILSILTTLSSLAVVIYTDTLTELVDIPFLAENPLFAKILSIVIVGLLAINSIYSIVTKYGWESLPQLLERLSTKLTRGQKSVIKEQKKNCEKLLKNEKAVLDNYNKSIDSYKTLASIPNLAIADNKKEDYSKAVANVETQKNVVASLEEQIKALDLKLKGKK